MLQETEEEGIVKDRVSELIITFGHQSNDRHKQLPSLHCGLCSYKAGKVYAVLCYTKKMACRE